MAPGEPVMIQYTSGTTGFPKGAVLQHRGLVNNGHHYFDRMGVKPGDTYITQMPLFHTAGSVMSMLGCIGMGCTQVLVDQFDPGLVLRLCEEHQVNGMLGVPTMLIALLEHPNFDTTDLSAITAVSSGGSVVPEQLVRTFEDKLGAPFTILFGQTECSPTATMNFVDDSIEDKALTIGTAMPNTEVKIIDPDTGEPAYRLGLRHDQITALSLMALTGADGRRVAEIEALRAQHDEAMAALVKRVEALEKERPSASL